MRTKTTVLALLLAAVSAQAGNVTTAEALEGSEINETDIDLNETTLSLDDYLEELNES